ncbi:conserved hypothetical protein [Pseudoclavibacter sp. 8L]|nr:conserved hypothetical protein [Pseudoclavibacter sp. 8L]
MAAKTHLLAEHNSACERAKNSSCHCFCHGAGHQIDLLTRAVSCTTDGENSIHQLALDLESVYGGFHLNVRDTQTRSRRRVPDDLADLNLERGRGATWTETLVLDEALHAAFTLIARSSVHLPPDEREEREVFVRSLAEGALKIVGGDVETHNICDSHVWCSVLAEANANPTAPRSTDPASPLYGRICYPRGATARTPSTLNTVRAGGLRHVQSILDATSNTSARLSILNLMGAASCPDLWHHPAAVRYSLLPFVTDTAWPPEETTELARASGFNEMQKRWERRGNW